jgi:hypothetical protein
MVREGELEGYGRRPKKMAGKIAAHVEEMIVVEGKMTGYGAQRLTGYLFQKYGHEFSMNTVKKVLRRNQVAKKKLRTKGGARRYLYDYEHLEPFREFQLDTKHILDKRALPEMVYEHIVTRGLPKYEWNMVDVATRARFTAYSHSLSAVYGFSFVVLVVLWLRGHNVRGRISIRVDNGGEFCGGSAQKLEEWNSLLGLLDAELKPIPPGAKHLQAIVENTHRKDDESFFAIHPPRCEDTEAFLYKAQRWQDTWNTARPSYGIAMKGRTPLRKLRDSKAMISEHILSFSVLLMEDVVKNIGPAVKWFETYLGVQFLRLGGTYVCARYLLSRKINRGGPSGPPAPVSNRSKNQPPLRRPRHGDRRRGSSSSVSPW